MRIGLAVALALCLAGCESAPSRQPIDLRTVVSNPAEFDGKPIAVHACINVIVHGVALLPCGERRPNIDIKAPSAGPSHYDDLVSYAHRNMGSSPEELPVVVSGQFQDSASTGEARHSITITSFTPEATR